VAAPDLLDINFFADIDGMHEAFRVMRAEAPAWRDEKNELWAVVQLAPLVETERRADVFSSKGCYRSRVAEQEEDMIAKDDPEHHEQRALVSRRFTPKAVHRLEPAIDATINDLIDDFIDAGEFEVVDELAAAMPARLTGHLLGFGEDKAASIRSWSERLMRIDQLENDPDVLLGMMGAIQEFAADLAPLVEARQQTPHDDLISIWANTGIDIGVLVQETGLFISGGAETTRTVIARGLYELTKHPDAWETMGTNPGSIPVATEEIIRWVTPLNNMFRTATRDADIAGTPVKAGDRIMLCYPSANRDEKVFDNPYTFDITRQPNPHVAFGFGTHFCLGASLARLELRMLFKALSARITNLRVLTEPDIEPNIFVGAVRSFRLGFDRRWLG
jgi:cytochrome P450 family 142 subfamily A polypeptide 1